MQRLRQKPSLTNGDRTTVTNEHWKGIRTKFVIQTTVGGIAFMLWFLMGCSYLFGTLFESQGRHAAIHILAVDYDGGVVGESMLAAYEQLKGPGFFTLRVHTPEEFPTEEDMYHSVWKGDYWGAIAVNQGASERLAAAIQGEDASIYDPAGALTYIWNQQYYTAFAESVVLASMQELVIGTGIAYEKINGTQAVQILDTQNPAAIEALLNPISAGSRNVKSAPYATVILLNTFSMIVPIIQQFFFILVINGAMRQYQLYTKMTVHSSLLVRGVASLLFTLGAALCQTGYFWAFKQEWNVNGNQFVLTWLTFWLLMHIHYLILDFISAITPLAVMPFVMLLWVFLNLASSLSPTELQPGFYHWGLALPSNEAYSVVMTIWCGGAHNRLYRALPILFSWWVLANILTSITHVRACNLAWKLENEQHPEKLAAKDIEAGVAPESEPTVSRATTLNRIPTLERAARKEREIYGPSIPPFA